MKLLVIGSGGREFAICRKLVESPSVEKVYCAPGNPGMSEIGVQQVSIDENDFASLVGFVKENDISLTMVGPEDVLSAGIVDYFKQEGLKIVGPDREAAQLESSKEYALHFMDKFDIPTASYHVCTSQKEVQDYLNEVSFPTVIKENGLAGGKGVYIVNDYDAAQRVCDGLEITVEKPVIFEEFLSGSEYSIFVLLNQKSFQVLPLAQDHKKALDDDQGLNTGGMGAYSPVPQFSHADYEKTKQQIIIPTVNGIRKSQLNYTGILYIGIIMTSNGPKVIEYNVRLGDPETQVVLPRVQNDFGELLAECVNQQEIEEIQVNDKAYVNVVLAAKGYPQKYNEGQRLPRFDVHDLGMIDYANVTAGNSNNLKGNGGRILSVIGVGNSLQEAQQRAYQILSDNPVDDTYYRHDIANRALNQNQ